MSGMDGLGFFLQSANAPFLAAAFAVLLVGGVEIVSLLTGFSASSLVDDALPDLDAAPDVDPGIDVDADLGGAAEIDAAPGADAGADSGAAAAGLPDFAAVLGWLNFGRVPFLANLVLFCAAFALAGYGIQAAAALLSGGLLPAAIAALCALPPSVLAARGIGRLLSRLVPALETDAVPISSLAGSTAVVTVGVARPGFPAEAKARDARGHVHYVRVEPYAGGASLPAGAEVLLVELEGGVFRAEAVAAPPAAPPVK